MVVSKDSKRKRKESPPPQPPVIESSPEMPKRTKVQAQRKFAQGQNAPTSSYTTTLAASSSSTAGGGPSASSESREPPTEILPNKRPKTEDFLTFLCFRGTSALPAHLDFLNQGKEGEDTAVRDTSNKKKGKVATKTPKKQTTKKGKKGKNTKTKAKSNEEPVASTSAAAAAARSAENNVTASTTASPPICNSSETTKNRNELVVDHNGKLSNRNEWKKFSSSAGNEAAVEPKEVQSNRRNRFGNNEKTTDEKPSKFPEKRRSNRNQPKDSELVIDCGDNANDNNTYLASEDVAELQGKEIDEEVSKRSKSTSASVHTSSIVTKDNVSVKQSSNCKGRKGKNGSAKTHDLDSKDIIDDRTVDSQNSEQKGVQQLNKQQVKQPVKRSRAKESPIFIPSPEPTGRMTRQRAFFEPVKITSVDPKEQRVEKGVPDNVESPTENDSTPTDVNKVDTEIGKSNEENSAEDSKDATLPQTKAASKVNSLNVFDFSSDDEQPLSKTIKLKRGAAGGKKRISQAAAKRKGKKTIENRDPESGADETARKAETEVKEETENKALVQQAEPTVLKNKRLGKVAKKKQTITESKAPNEVNTEEVEEEVADEIRTCEDLAKKATSNARQPRKLNRTKPDATASSSGPNAPTKKSQSASPSAPVVRSQRPSRKTKEAAAIYMGIIGHKLQQDDEDDDLSLNSFPDLPNVKEMEKMESELKKNTASSSASPTVSKSPTKMVSATESEKQAFVGRRGRPPKQTRLPTSLPAKREIEGMLVKKGALTKTISAQVQSDSNKETPQPEISKLDSEDEDFLLNEEVNETKRKLEKSFSDSDDEPLAVKANLKSSDKDLENDSRKSESDQQLNVATMLPTDNKEIAASSPSKDNAMPTSVAASIPVCVASQNAALSQTNACGKGNEKKSPISNSKLLNVPSSYALASTNQSSNAFISKMEHKLISPNLTSYLPPSSPHYPSPQHQTRHPALPAAVKSPTQPPPPPTAIMTHIAAPPPQSPLKYPTTPTTYPPPIEAYPSPKINPNFLTPKFDRSTLPRTNNFSSPSPLKFDLSSKTSAIGNSTQSPKQLAQTLPGGANVGPAHTSTPPTTSTAAAVVAGTQNTSSDPLKDEIGSILAANLMPSKEESGKIFGIASVSLAQSSGPDNTKCTLGKCGSIHKPVLGPVVPTEGYIGDQLSSKERRKAKVNMTHEQIQKWLIECSSNPDEIQDDMDDDYDDNLRPNLFATTPPPTRDDKESTSFSSSSKATRDLGKSESAWSGKGPSLKAIPVVASTSIKEEPAKSEYVALQPMQVSASNETPQAGSAMPKGATTSSAKANCGHVDNKSAKEKVFEKKQDKKVKEEKLYRDANKDREPKQAKSERDKEQHAVTSTNTKMSAASKQSAAQTASAPELASSSTTSKTNRKKNLTAATTPSSVREEKQTQKQAPSAHTTIAAQKRTPVYNQKVAQKQVELRETTASHKKKSPFSQHFAAFSVDNEKSIYSFDKDDDEDCVGGSKVISKPVFRRQSRRDSQQNDEMTPTTSTPTPRSSPVKKRNAATAEKPPKDIANASQNSSVSLTLSPSENCKLVKVSLEAEQQTSATSKSKVAKFKSKLNAPSKPAAETGADSDSDGHTFYIPLQGTGTGGSAEGGIQGVAVKLGREGPEGPNQKVIMHATLVTKAQMGQNSKPLPDSMNASEIVKNLLISSGSSTAETAKKPGVAAAAVASTSAAAAANSAANSLKSVPVGTVQPRFKGTADPSAATAAQPSTSMAAVGGSGLVRVNSNSSLFSGSAKSRHGAAGSANIGSGGKKFKDDTPIKMSNNTAFPRHDDPTQMVEAPIFRPTEKEFSDPIDFIERITPIAARFGICKIVPPSVFKPECRISDEMRFTAYNQYVHKMLHRWGPSAKELSAIKKYLATQSIVMNHPPWIGGMEVDLPRLYHTVQELGGLKEVIEKKKWARVAEEMCIPKLAQDRVTKLDDIYCKYLLPYDTLSPTERQKLFDEVEADWAKREARARRNADRFVNTESVSNEEDDVSSNDDEESEEEVDGVSMECIVKGRSMPLSQFYRIARNTMTLWFKNTEPTVNEVEAEFWRHVAVRDSHVCVHSGSIDSSGWGYGFPSPGPKGKGSNYARHPWNLKVLTNNSGSVLRSLGPVMGVTVPTLHVGMLFSACCWYRDPHGLSWIEYLHTGASKLWYGIPDDQSANFRAALTSLIPTHCQNKTIWLPCDTVMVPPHMLTDRGVSLCRIEQKPGEFIVVFPRAYTSSLATGYVVSESVYFATSSWLDLAKDDFKDIHDSCEPAMFSLEQLLFALGSDQRVSSDTLQQMLPMLNEVFEKETAAREQLKAAGVTSTEKVSNEKGSKSKKHPVKSMESECDLCRANLYISMVRTDEGNVYCLQHALKNLNNGNIQAKQCKLIFSYNIEDVENLIKTLNDKIQQKRIGTSNKRNK